MDQRKQAKSKTMSNEELLAAVRAACADVHRHTTVLIHLLIDVEERQVHRLEGYSSMFEFCVRAFDMSEGEAHLRLTAARAIRDYPMLDGLIERGELCLSTLALLRPHLTPESVGELVEAARGKTKMGVRELLAARAPKPIKPGSLRKLPTIATSDAVEPVVERHIEPVAESRYRLGVTVTRSERDEVLYVRDLTRHSNPSGDFNVLFMSSVRAYRREAERAQFGGPGPRKTPVPRTRKSLAAKATRKVPRSVRAAVFERDGHRCTYESAKGHRCASTAFLEIDHVVPFAQGGKHDETNLRVRCFAHNQLYAAQTYGADFMREKIHLSQLKSGVRKAGAQPGKGAPAPSSLSTKRKTKAAAAS